MLYQIYSNTTLVKVKLNALTSNVSINQNSNTTLVKVKFFLHSLS